jgi:predicted DsbA family dithiol-disulfide isomerase
LEEANVVGLSKEEALAALNNDEIKQKVRTLQTQWRQLGVNGVPTVVFNRTGAQPQETFKQVLQELVQQGE